MFLQKIIKSTDTSDIIVFKPSSILHILLHYSPRCTRYTTPHSPPPTTNIFIEHFLLMHTSVFPLVLTIFWVTGMMMTGSEGECWDDYSDSSTIYIIVTPMILALTVTNKKTGIFVTCNLYFRDRPILEF